MEQLMEKKRRSGRRCSLWKMDLRLKSDDSSALWRKESGWARSPGVQC
jgi:hypothetical protein